MLFFHGNLNIYLRLQEDFLLSVNPRGKNSLIRAGYGGWLMYTAASMEIWVLF